MGRKFFFTVLGVAVLAYFIYCFIAFSIAHAEHKYVGGKYGNLVRSDLEEIGWTITTADKQVWGYISSGDVKPIPYVPSEDEAIAIGRNLAPTINIADYAELSIITYNYEEAYLLYGTGVTKNVE